MIGNQIDIETSEEQSTPIILYKINIGQVDYLLTSYNESVVYNSQKYDPIQIDHDEVVIDMTVFDDKMSISVPLLSTQGLEWSKDKLLSRNTVEILRYQPITNTAITMYRGVVVGRKYTDTHIILDCLPISIALNKMCNRAIYSRQCRHKLYSEECGVDRNEFKFQSNVTEYSLYSVVTLLPKEYKFNPDLYVGGMVKISKDNYNIITNATDFVIKGEVLEVKLENPMTADIKNFKIEIFQTCDKSMEDCANRFNNIKRFGGFPYIPIRNIFVHNISY